MGSIDGGKAYCAEVIGVGLGLAGAFALSRVLGALMPRVAAFDPILMVAVAAGLCAIALVACWLPARRATMVDPLTALRTE